MERFLDFFRNAGAARISAIAITILATVLFIVFLTTRYTNEEQDLLFSKLKPEISQEVILELSKRNIAYSLKKDGEDIYVPKQQARQLRIDLAEIGLAGDVVGYEIFDREQSLGTSSFMQNINKLRALEGELARTIASIEGVRAARVHLVLPERPLFSKEQRDPKATVFIQMQSEKRLESERVNAIQYLLATAVPDLLPTQISIIDDKGALLARGGGDIDSVTASDAESRRVKIEEDLRTKIEDILGRSLGFDSIRIAVNVDMDFSEIVVNNETYNPDGRVLRSSENVEELSTSDTGLDSPVTIGNNIPNTPSPANGGDTTSSEQSSRSEERNNYEISRVIENTVHRPGRIKRISVAVLVDGTYEPSLENANVMVYQERTPEDIERIDRLVKSAIGFDNVQRNDEVNVVTMQFKRFAGEETNQIEEIYLGFLTASDAKKVIELAILAGIGMLVIILIIRPLVGQLFESAPVSLYTPAVASGIVRTPDGRSVFVDPETGMQTEIPIETAETLIEPEDSALNMGQNQEASVQKIDLDKISGKMKDSSARKINEIVEKYPEEAVMIIRTWLSQE